MLLGLLVIGIQDKTKNIVGQIYIMQDEKRITNAVADSVDPVLLPNLQFFSLRGKDQLIVTLPLSLGPFYIKDKGETAGVYVRLGSPNHIADVAMIAEIKRLKDHISDQLSELRASLIVDVSSHPEADWFDHSFLSLTYKKPLKDELFQFLGIQ